jgi:transposase-like protein
MIPNEILYTTAIDQNDHLIHVNNAEKGSKYYCPLCKKEFILKKSGKSGKGSRRPHFAHNELTPNCTPEGVLHYSFKKMLISLLESYKNENKDLIMSWRCSSCEYTNSVFLLQRVASIKEEFNLGVCRPDIALLDETGKVIAVIEIVVNHSPEEYALNYYRGNKIVLIQINLQKEDELLMVEGKLSKPSYVEFCINPKCNAYKNYEIKRKIIFETVVCSNRLHMMKKCFIGIESIFGRQKSMEFTHDEIEGAKYNGVNLRVAKNETIPKFICIQCQRFRNQFSRRGRL